MDTEVMKQRVVPLLPDGVELMGLFPVERLALWKEKEPVAPKDIRPEVFSDLRMSGSFPYKVWSAGMQIFWSESLSGSPEMCADEQQRAEWKRKGKPYYGGWRSLAGQFQAAVQPCSRWWRVWSFLAVTPNTLQVFYAPAHQSSAFEIGDGAVAGWRVAREDLVWVRQHKSESHFEFGFLDGSWLTLNITEHEHFRNRFPGILPANAPAPL